MTDEGRYAVRDAYNLPGWFVVVDTTTGMMARNSKGKAVFCRTREQADQVVGRLTDVGSRNHVCLVCRHRRPAEGMVGKVCSECQEKA
jgi:hypothetical protein